MRVAGTGQIGTQFADFCGWRSAGLPINSETQVRIDPHPTASQTLVIGAMAYFGTR